MEEKRYGVNVTLLKELEHFQLSLLKKRRTMPFISECLVAFNNAELKEMLVQADTGSLSIGHVLTLLIDSDTLLDHCDNRANVEIPDMNLKLTIYFKNVELKNRFVAALGNTNPELLGSEALSSGSGREVQ